MARETTPRFDERNGWVYDEATVDGRSVLQCHALEASPHNVSFIWFAPNHVRAFRRSIYELTGGYDATRDVLDDQDLMCRMYQLTEFHLIDECLYLQRMHEANTQREIEINARIQQETVVLYDRYVEPNALAWADRRGLKALFLGSADSQAIRLSGRRSELRDPASTSWVTSAKGLDLPDSSVGVIRVVDFLPNVPDKVSLFNEFYRLLASWRHGADPDAEHRRARGVPGPDACRVLQREFLLVLHGSGLRTIRSERSSAGSKSSRLVTYFPTEWHEQHKIPYVCANLIAIKEGPRQGGFLQI